MSYSRSPNSATFLHSSPNKPLKLLYGSLARLGTCDWDLGRVKNFAIDSLKGFGPVDKILLVVEPTARITVIDGNSDPL